MVDVPHAHLDSVAVMASAVILVLWVTLLMVAVLVYVTHLPSNVVVEHAGHSDVAMMAMAAKYVVQQDVHVVEPGSAVVVKPNVMVRASLVGDLAAVNHESS